MNTAVQAYQSNLPQSDTPLFHYLKERSVSRPAHLFSLWSKAPTLLADPAVSLEFYNLCNSIHQSLCLCFHLRLLQEQIQKTRLLKQSLMFQVSCTICRERNLGRLPCHPLPTCAKQGIFLLQDSTNHTYCWTDVRVTIGSLLSPLPYNCESVLFRASGLIKRAEKLRHSFK